jgi:heat shock protein HslJ
VVLLKSRLYPLLLIVSLASLLVAGCAGTSQDADLEDIKWTLESYGEPGNLVPVIEGTRITATFESAEGQVRGSAGCNSYFGDYAIDNKLSITTLAHTEMYCMDPEGVMEQETEYLKILLTAGSYQVQDGRLQIDCGNQLVLIYTEQAGEE